MVGGARAPRGDLGTGASRHHPGALARRLQSRRPRRQSGALDQCQLRRRQRDSCPA